MTASPMNADDVLDLQQFLAGRQSRFAARWDQLHGSGEAEAFLQRLAHHPERMATMQRIAAALERAAQAHAEVDQLLAELQAKSSGEPS